MLYVFSVNLDEINLQNVRMTILLIDLIVILHLQSLVNVIQVLQYFLLHHHHQHVLIIIIIIHLKDIIELHLLLVHLHHHHHQHNLHLVIIDQLDQLFLPNDPILNLNRPMNGILPQPIVLVQNYQQNERLVMHWHQSQCKKNQK